MSYNIQAFLELVRAGLWEKEARLEQYGKVDFEEIYRLAGEQTVVGLVTAGMEHIQDVKAPQEIVLQCIGESLQLEQTNKAMNQFIAELIEKMRNADIYTLLVKGQAVAQCYEKPLWRVSGDVDLLLSDSNYYRAKELLVTIASEVEKEYVRDKHLGMTIDGFVVELHGTLRCGLSSRVEKGLDEIKRAVFYEGKVRSWMNGRTQVFLPHADEDVIYVFAHMLQHYYKEGLGLRQICDWCRLLWTYKDSLNQGLLESRIQKMGLMSEWCAFGAFAVEYLGMPADAMPLIDGRWKKEDGRCKIDNGLKRKADKICAFILEVGNMGHNRDMSYFEKYPYLLRKVCSMERRCGDLIRHARIFPLDSLRFFPYIMYNGLRSAVRGE